MRLFFLPLLFGFATATSCPYASQAKTSSSACPYANAPRDQSSPVARSTPAEGKEGVFFMNRIAPSISELYIANADGTNETLLLGNNSSFDYHAQWSPDGQWIVFTS